MFTGIGKRCPSYEAGVKVMRTPAVSWWILGGIMFVFSLFLWPSPAVALVGAIVLPIAVQSGLTPLAAAMAMNLFGHGFALSYDAVIQGGTGHFRGSGRYFHNRYFKQGAGPLFWIMGYYLCMQRVFCSTG